MAKLNFGGVEEEVVTRIAAQTLRRAGVAAEHRQGLGNTAILEQALTSGQVDVYPEYTGNGAFFHADEKNPAWKQLDAGYQRIKSLDAEKHKLAWLAPAPANNTWAIAVRGDLAERMLPINLDLIPDDSRLCDTEIWPRWTDMQPRVLGAVLDLAASVARMIPSLRLDSKPRMADFAKIVETSSKAPART